MSPSRATAAAETVPVESARRLLLAGSALDRAPARATKARVIALVRELGFVQVDSISSVERAHHLVFHARLDGYDPPHRISVFGQSCFYNRRLCGNRWRTDHLISLTWIYFP